MNERDTNTSTDYYKMEIPEVLKELRTSENGLSSREVIDRQRRFGPNELLRASKRNFVVILFRQFKSAMIVLLFFAALLSWFTGNRIDGIVILIVVLIDASIGFFMEWKAERAVSSLSSLLTPTAKVIRDSQRLTCAASELVTGDLIVVEEGDNVPADARIIHSRSLRAIEASLTGESVPSSKTDITQEATTSIADQKNMLWKSTFVASGYATAVVTAIGSSTAIGRIAVSLSSIKPQKSHFQKKVDSLATQMAIASLIAALILFLVGYFSLNIKLNELLLISIAAMVSVIPEGLQSIIVIVLAIGSQRMSKRKAIIRDFSATETLGAVSTIITDKTGTLTENALTVKNIFIHGHETIHVTGEGWAPIGTFVQNDLVLEPEYQDGLLQVMQIAALCNNASIIHSSNENYELTGDPTEGALLVMAKKAGVDASTLKLKRKDDLPFESRFKMRASIVEDNNQNHLFVIGAPEVVLERCVNVVTKTSVEPLSPNVREVLTEKAASWSSSAMRVIALARKNTVHHKVEETDLNGLTFTALVGMIDPPRAEVREAIEKCKTAGIRVIMATGDHLNTAAAISKSVGIIGDTTSNGVTALSEEQLMRLDDSEFDHAIKTTNVFARLNPETKLKIATRLQALGELVAMTGDGVNDAPALKKADIGIAMGIMGTDVARDSSKVVLADDNFATIVNAIEEGRIVFLNARQATFYLITTNIAEICTLILSIAMGLPIPLTAIQILWLNLVTDGIGDMALAAERGHEDALRRKPLHKDERILNKSILPFLSINVVLMVSISIGAYYYFLPRGIESARSAVFVAMSFTQLFNLYNMRSLTTSVFRIGFFSNIYVTITILLSAILTFALIEVPMFRNIFGFGPMALTEFFSLVIASSTVLIAGESYKLLNPKGRM